MVAAKSQGKKPKAVTGGKKGKVPLKPISKKPKKSLEKAKKSLKKDDSTKKKGESKSKGKKEKTKKIKKGPRCAIKRRNKALKRKCYSLTDPRALLNTYYTMHGVVEMVNFRKFKWKKK